MFRRLLSVGLMLLFIKTTAQIPLWQWAAEASSAGNEQAWDVCTDPGGSNIYVAGSYDANFGIIYNLPFLTSAKDGFISKYSSSGTLIWAVRIGGSDDDEVKSISLDPSGNVYVTGYFKGTADFDPALFSSFNLVATGNKDAFLAKYTSGGALVWAVKIAGAQNEEGRQVFADGSSVYLTGYYESAATFYSTSAVTKTTTASQSSRNFFGARYTSAGVVHWIASGGSAGPDEGLDLVADNSKVYFTGNFSGSFSLYDENGIQTSSLSATPSGSTDVFVTAWQNSGTFAWITAAGSAGEDQGNAITQDSSWLFISGSFKNDTMFFPVMSPSLSVANRGGRDIYLACLLKSSGAVQ